MELGLKRSEVIFIVDDEDAILELLEEAFVDLGHTVLKIKTLEDYKAAITNFEPNALITDLKLEHDSGIDVIKLTQELASLIPIFVISGNTRKFENNDIDLSKISSLEAKPFNLNHYCDKVEQAIPNHYLSV
jgi:DNA-binding NtrC family response regulator